MSGSDAERVGEPDGLEVVLAVRGPGALLGELSAVDREPRSATIQAVEPLTALVMPLPEFEAYLSAHGRVAYLLMRMLAQRLRDADRKRIEFGAQDSTGDVPQVLFIITRYLKPFWADVVDGRAKVDAVAPEMSVQVLPPLLVCHW